MNITGSTTVEEQPKRYLVTLDLSEEEAVALYTVVANVAKFGVAYELCNAFEQLGLDWDTDLVEFKDADGDGGIFFKDRA